MWQLMEVMTVRAGGGDGLAAGRTGSTAHWPCLGRASALALGPGLGREKAAARVCPRALAMKARVAMVLDADGLNAHAGHLSGSGCPQSAHRAHAARGRAGRVLGPRQRGDRARAPAVTFALRPDNLRRGGRCSRETTRSSRRRTGGLRSIRGGSPALGDRRHRGCALRSDLGFARTGTRCVHEPQPAGPTSTPRPDARRRARQGSAEGVIATDVIAALPAGARDRWVSRAR